MNAQSSQRGNLVSKKEHAWGAFLAAPALLVATVAHADWLAADPGTPISLQINVNGDLVARPIGGAWSHPLCSDVTAAELSSHRPGYPQSIQRLTEMLIAAAASGSLVNVFAEADECDEHGHPVIRNLRIQGP
jgi:hypothetical protein